jgi:hypothetical protein
VRLPDPIRAWDVLKHDKGRHVAVKNRRAVWQVYYAWKHQVFWFAKIVKTEYQWVRRNWFSWLEK